MRRYEPKIEPSSSNKILLHFSTNDTDNDMLLFHLGKEDNQVKMRFSRMYKISLIKSTCRRKEKYINDLHFRMSS